MPNFDTGNALSQILPNQIHTDVNGNQWLNQGVNANGDYIIRPVATGSTTGLEQDVTYAAAPQITNWAEGGTTAALDAAGFNVGGNDGRHFILRTPTKDIAYEYMHPNTWTAHPDPTTNGTDTFLQTTGAPIYYSVGTERWSLPEPAGVSWLSRGSAFTAPTDGNVHLLYDHPSSDIFPNGIYAADGTNWAQKSPLSITTGTASDTALKSFPFTVDALTLANGFITLPETPVNQQAIMLQFRGNPTEFLDVDFTFDAGTNQIRFPALLRSLVVGDRGRVYYVGAA